MIVKCCASEFKCIFFTHAFHFLLKNVLEVTNPPPPSPIHVTFLQNIPMSLLSKCYCLVLDFMSALEDAIEVLWLCFLPVFYICIFH